VVSRECRVKWSGVKWSGHSENTRDVTVCALALLSVQDVYRGTMLMFTFEELHGVGNLMSRLGQVIERTGEQQSAFPQ